MGQGIVDHGRDLWKVQEYTTLPRSLRWERAWCDLRVRQAACAGGTE